MKDRGDISVLSFLCKERQFHRLSLHALRGPNVNNCRKPGLERKGGKGANTTFSEPKIEWGGSPGEGPLGSLLPSPLLLSTVAASLLSQGLPSMCSFPLWSSASKEWERCLMHRVTPALSGFSRSRWRGGRGPVGAPIAQTCCGSGQ